MATTAQKHVISNLGRFYLGHGAICIITFTNETVFKRALEICTSDDITYETPYTDENESTVVPNALAISAENEEKLLKSSLLSKNCIASIEYQ